MILLKSKILFMVLIAIIVLSTATSFAVTGLKGDMDNDGKITIIDIRLLLQDFINQPSINEEQNCDIQGHDYSVVVDVEEYCSESGRIIKKCSRCNSSTVETIPAVGHSYITTYNSLFHWVECERCQERLTSEIEHVFDDSGICTICGCIRRDNLNYLFGIAGETTETDNVKYVQIGNVKYEVESGDFEENALVCYTEDGNLVTLVRNISATLLDNGEGIGRIYSVQGTSAGNQIIRFNDSIIDTNSNTSYKTYSVANAKVSESQTGVVLIDDCELVESISDIEFRQGDRVLIDDNKKIFVVFTGLSNMDDYENGVNVDNSPGKYIVRYEWADNNPCPGVSLPLKDVVNEGTLYNVSVPYKEGYNFTSSVGNRITVIGNTTIYISWEEIH